MARFESEGTWFAAEEVAKRARAAPRLPLAQPAPHAARLEEAEHRLRGLAEAVEKGHWSTALLVANARIFLAGGH
jgi:hypothetical protein